MLLGKSLPGSQFLHLRHQWIGQGCFLFECCMFESIDFLPLHLCCLSRHRPRKKRLPILHVWFYSSSTSALFVSVVLTPSRPDVLFSLGSFALYGFCKVSPLHPCPICLNRDVSSFHFTNQICYFCANKQVPHWMGEEDTTGNALWGHF